MSSSHHVNVVSVAESCAWTFLKCRQLKAGHHEVSLHFSKHGFSSPSQILQTSQKPSFNRVLGQALTYTLQLCDRSGIALGLSTAHDSQPVNIGLEIIIFEWSRKIVFPSGLQKKETEPKQMVLAPRRAEDERVTQRHMLRHARGDLPNNRQEAICCSYFQKVLPGTSSRLFGFEAWSHPEIMAVCSVRKRLEYVSVLRSCGGLRHTDVLPRKQHASLSSGLIANNLGWKKHRSRGIWEIE